MPISISDVNNKELYTKVAIFTYSGEEDPVRHIDKAIAQYVSDYKSYKQFVDMNMDNPWVRIVTIELNKDEMRDHKLKSVIE